MKEGIAIALIVITYQLLLESIPFCAKFNDHAIIQISDYRLGFRPTALKTLFRPCSEKHTLESNRNAGAEFLSTKHLYNSFSTASPC